MPIDMRIWSVKDDKLHPVPTEKLEKEATLEDWLTDDISMVADDLLVIGRQLSSPLGGILDLLAIDADGDLAVLELKRDRTPRDVVAQALHYAAWIRTLTWDEVNEIATGHFGGEVALAERFLQRFGRPLPETVNSAHRIYIVATNLDPVSETIVTYLSEVYQVNINAVFFRHYRDADGDAFVARSWLMEPSQVQERGEAANAKRRPHLSIEELRNLAVANGVAETYDALCDFFIRNGDAIRRTPNNIAFVFGTSGGQTAGFSVYPARSSRDTGIYADVRPGYLSEAFGVPEDAVRAALPLPGSSKDAHGEIYWFRNMDDVRRLIEALGERAEGAVESDSADI